MNANPDRSRIFSFVVIVVLSAIMAVPALPSFAQTDTTDNVIIESEDTVLMKSHAKRFDPRKALLYAAVIPGLGQVYNKKYWKLPLVYGGFAAIGWNINLYHGHYTDFKEQLYFNLQNGLTNTSDVNPESGISTGQLRSIVDRTRRERDFWIIMIGAMYLLQIVDAHVDAHLKEFDLNPNLRVSAQPMIERNSLTGRNTGFSLTVKF
jgi:hypothetical protein